MRFEIESSPLVRESVSEREEFSTCVRSAKDPDEAVRRFAAERYGELTSEPQTLQGETIATMRTDRGLYLVRLSKTKARGRS